MGQGDGASREEKQLQPALQVSAAWAAVAGLRQELLWGWWWCVVCGLPFSLEDSSLFPSRAKVSLWSLA